MARARAEWKHEDDERAKTVTNEPLSAFERSFDFEAETERLPALLQRSDGETLLYSGKLNVLHGTPGCGKP